MWNTRIRSVTIKNEWLVRLEMSVLSDNDTMEIEQSEEVMMNELQMIIRSKVNDMIAAKEKTIKSLEDSVISKTDLLEEVIEAKLILETTVDDLKKINEIKSLQINDLRLHISQENNETVVSNRGRGTKTAFLWKRRTPNGEGRTRTADRLSFVQIARRRTTSKGRLRIADAKNF